MVTTTGQPTRTLRSRRQAPGAKATVLPAAAPAPAKKAAREKAKGLTQVEGVLLKPLVGEVVCGIYPFRTLPDVKRNQVIYFGYDSCSNAAIFILDCAARTSIKLTGDDMNFISPDGTLVDKEFPDLIYTSAVLIYTGQDRLVLSFGGSPFTGKEITTAVSSLFLFNIDKREWTEVPPPTEGAPLPRVSGTGIWKDSRFYVFGGRVLIGQGANAKLEDARSYSILEVGGFAGDDWTTIELKWIFSDKEYPGGSPYVGFMGGFGFCSDGKEVLLLPGAPEEVDTVSYKAYRPLKYNFECDSFTFPNLGDFQKLPDNVDWYHAMPPTVGHPLLAKLRPFKGLDPAGKPRTVSFLRLMRTSSTREGTKKGSLPYISSLWAVSVAQDIQIQEVGICVQVDRLSIANKADFYSFATTGNKMYFVGKSTVKNNERGYLAEV